MKFVINTSVIISALIKKKSTALVAILKTKHELYVPAYTFEELLKHMKRIEEKSELSLEEIYTRMALLVGKLRVVPKQKVMKSMRMAEEIIGHRDKKDVPFVATLLVIEGDGIVSYDSDFEEIIRHGYKWIKPRDLVKM